MEKNASAVLAKLIEIIETKALKEGVNVNTMKGIFFESLLKNISHSTQNTCEVMERWVAMLSKDSI
jgi:hypothetical protein